MKILNKPSQWESARPSGVKASKIVLHTTQGTDEGDLSYMTNPDDKANVSYHYLVQRDGDIWQLVEDNRKAWHAGVSVWEGRKNVNNFSIGVGFSNKKGEMLTEEQYKAGGELVAHLMKTHKLAFDDVLTHENVSYPRKDDPWWTFEFGRFYGWVLAYLVPHLISKEALLSK